jgi:C-terminal processing protease CtpA/Prc
VITNGASLSGAELFAEVMKQIPFVTVVGDTTAGGGCNDRDVNDGDRRLPSGKLIHIPTGCILRYDGALIEWNGVTPDVLVTQTEADVLRGRDLQLEFAIELLR